MLRILFLLSSLLFFNETGWSQPIKYKPRHQYQQKLEPGNHILIGAGQSGFDSFNAFVQACDSSIFPEIIMDYDNLDNWKKEKLENKIGRWKQYPWIMIPQIGLAMTYDGNPEKHYEQRVAEGRYDSSIQLYANTLATYPGQIMLRLGYEFNGHWNGYEPENFVKAYRRVASILKEKLGKRLALVWCMALDGDKHDFMSYFPGDDVVDWWSVDVFGEKHFVHPILKPFLDSAHAHRRPVLIGECTPRRVSVQLGKESIERWFRPFFELLAENPGIKGISYIYWDWSKTRWTDWGDGRFGENAEVKKFVLEELKKPIFRKVKKKEAVIAIPFPPED